MNESQAYTEARKFLGPTAFARKVTLPGCYPRCVVGTAKPRGRRPPLVTTYGIAISFPSALKQARKAVRTRRLRRYAIEAAVVAVVLTLASWALVYV